MLPDDGITLEWVCSGDIAFEPNADLGVDVGIYPIKSTDGTKTTAPFLIFRKNARYKIAQLYDYEYDPEQNEYSCEKFRHPSLIKQQYGLPQNIPTNQFVLGPMICVNLIRILRIVQASLSNEKEVREDALYNLTEYYANEPVQRPKPAFSLLKFA